MYGGTPQHFCPLLHLDSKGIGFTRNTEMNLFRNDRRKMK